MVLCSSFRNWPKIKYYFGVKGENFKDAEEKLEALKKAMTE